MWLDAAVFGGKIRVKSGFTWKHLIGIESNATVFGLRTNIGHPKVLEVRAEDLSFLIT